MSTNPNTDDLIKNFYKSQNDELIKKALGSIKSQHELNTCNDGKRSSDVLVEAISKLETTTKELDKTKKQLDIAKSYLNVIKCLRNGKCLQCVDFAYRALRKIEELEK